VLAEPLVASRLGVKVGAALIDLRSLMTDQKGRAVEYVEMLAVPEHLKLRFTVHPRSTQSAPAPDIRPKTQTLEEEAMSNAANFRKLLSSGKMIVAPGAIDGITGRAIDRAGFQAAYMTGAGTSA
jgi:hypothetical protein